MILIFRYQPLNEHNFLLERDLLMSFSVVLPSVESVPITVGNVGDVTPPETLGPEVTPPEALGMEVVLCVAVLRATKYTVCDTKNSYAIYSISLANVPYYMTNIHD